MHECGHPVHRCVRAAPAGCAPGCVGEILSRNWIFDVHVECHTRAAAHVGWVAEMHVGNTCQFGPRSKPRQTGPHQAIGESTVRTADRSPIETTGITETRLRWLGAATVVGMAGWVQS